jgi:hypothetical protein
MLRVNQGLKRPKGYKGRIYENVTEKHWNYLTALANCGDQPVRWDPDWKEAYKKLTGLEPTLPPGTMTHGVFEARGWIKILKEKSLFRYQITTKGRAALADRDIQESCNEAENPVPLTLEDSERLDQAPLNSREQAKQLLQRFRAYAPSFSVRNIPRYERSKIGQALKALYDGHCQICDFTFRKKDGTNFAEVHHLEALSEGGKEDPKNLLVVCANCHRQLHHAKVEKVGWEGDHLVLRINDELHRIKFDPDHLTTRE